MKTKSIIGIIIVLALVGTGIYFVAHDPASRPLAPDDGTSAASSTASVSYSLADVSVHASSASCWSAISGGVYDVTSWISQHPGGSQAILSLCGKDGTAGFVGQHGGQSRPEAELASFRIGTLVQ